MERHKCVSGIFVASLERAQYFAHFCKQNWQTGNENSRSKHQNMGKSAWFKRIII